MSFGRNPQGMSFGGLDSAVRTAVNVYFTIVVGALACVLIVSHLGGVLALGYSHSYFKRTRRCEFLWALSRWVLFVAVWFVVTGLALFRFHRNYPLVQRGVYTKPNMIAAVAVLFGVNVVHGAIVVIRLRYRPKSAADAKVLIAEECRPLNGNVGQVTAPPLPARALPDTASSVSSGGKGP